MSSTTTHKRLLTTESHQSRLASQRRDDATPPDLALRLQNIGSRIRKNVTEGYATNRDLSAPSSPHSSPTKSHPGQPLDHAVFRSASDTLRDVFSSMPLDNRSLASPRKRTRSAFASDQGSLDDVAIDGGGKSEMQIANAETMVFALGPDASGGRPVKPLRRSRRPFMETRSLPVGLLRFSGGLNDRDDLLPSVDDDWSLFDTNACDDQFMEL